MKSIFVLLALLFTFQISAQQFEGEIAYSISYLQVPKEMEGMESMLPTVMTYYFSGDKMAIQQDMMFGSQSVVVDNATNTGFVLMDMMGQKTAIKVDTTKGEEETAAPTVTKTSETNKIAGYNCTKYLVKNEGMDDMEAWVTTELKAKMGAKSPFGTVDGFPLEYVTFQDGVKTRFTVTSVSEKTIESTKFEIPEDYTIMTEEEMNSMGGE